MMRLLPTLVLLALWSSFSFGATQAEREQPAATSLLGLRDQIHDRLDMIAFEGATADLEQRPFLIAIEANIERWRFWMKQKTVDQLTLVERNFLERLGVALESPLNEDVLKELANGVAAVVEVSSGRQEPVITGYSPAFIAVDSTPAKDVPIQVNGYHLPTEATLRFGSVACATQQGRDRSMTFLCPRQLFGGISRRVIRQGELQFSTPSRLSSIFPDNPGRIQPISLVALPAALGTVAITAVVEGQNTERQTREQAFSHTNSHCSSDTNLRWRVNASEGWRILESSVNSTPTSVASGSSGPFVENITHEGFDVTGRAVNSGNCVKVLGQKVSRDGRGWVKGYARWTEERDVLTGGSVDLGTFPLSYVKPILVNLPEGATAFRAALEADDGTRIVADRSGEFGRMIVEFDALSRQLRIHPR